MGVHLKRRSSLKYYQATCSRFKYCLIPKVNLRSWSEMKWRFRSRINIPARVGNGADLCPHQGATRRTVSPRGKPN